MTTEVPPETDPGLPDDLDVSGLAAGPHEDEPHAGGLNNRLNWLRAGVLGANDGIVSTAGIVMGVAGATSDRGTILVAGVAGLVAGALSMAAGEYVSVEHPEGLRAGATGRGATRAERTSRRRSSRSSRALRREGAERGPGSRGGQAAHRPRCARRARGDRARHRPRRHHQPVERRAGLDARVHVGQHLLTAHHHPVRPDPAALDHRRLGDSRAGAHRLGECEVRLRPIAPGRRAQRGRRAVRDGGHLRDRICSRHPSSGRAPSVWRRQRRPSRTLAAAPTLGRRPVCLHDGALPAHALDDACIHHPLGDTP